MEVITLELQWKDRMKPSAKLQRKPQSKPSFTGRKIEEQKLKIRMEVQSKSFATNATAITKKVPSPDGSAKSPNGAKLSDAPPRETHE